MAGTSLQNNGDVQIGSDSGAYLACPGTKTGFDPKSYARALDFNPWIWPDLLTDDTPLWHRSGMRPGADIPTGRRIQFSVEVHDTSYGALSYKMGLLMGAARPVMNPGEEQELAFMYGGVKYVLYGRYREVDVQDVSRAGMRTLRVRISFFATDPVFYECVPQTATIPMFEFSMSGWENPANVATNINTVRSGISPPDIIISGDAPPRYVLQIKGPARNPVFMNCTDYQWMWLALPGGHTIASSLSNYVTNYVRTITNSSGAQIGHTHAFPSHWIELQPGPIGGNKLALAVNVTFTGSASMPGGLPIAGTLQWQRGWWMLS